MSAGISKNTKKQMLEMKRRELVDGLPHLYGFKHYAWSRQVFESFNKVVMLSAANQIGKSSASIRKCIHWATEPKTWPFISRLKKPTLFFYFYPSKVLARREIEHKWIPEFLPRADYKDHPQYGWKLYDEDRKLSIKFNTGVEVIFLGYAQGKADLLSLAASSPAAIFVDEEMPPELWPEVAMRLEATKGCLNFTATPVECYAFYREIFEGQREIAPNALVMTISMYDCVQFEDGSPGLYTLEDIDRRKSLLGTEAEIQQRVYGKYVVSEGLAYKGFRREVNIVPAVPVQEDWVWYAGIDIGSGGDNHPSAITFVAVAPNYKEARVVHCWRGGPHENTDHSDVLNKYLDLKAKLVGTKSMSGVYYDFAAKDFESLSLKAQVHGIQKANKDRKFGVGLVNSLFKNQMLSIEDTEPNHDLVEEIENLRVEANKRHAKDDAIDSLRYAVTSIPWDFSHITADSLKKTLPKPETTRALTDEEIRMGRSALFVKPADEIGEEINMWNSMMED